MTETQGSVLWAGDEKRAGCYRKEHPEGAPSRPGKRATSWKRWHLVWILKDKELTMCIKGWMACRVLFHLDIQILVYILYFKVME